MNAGTAFYSRDSVVRPRPGTSRKGEHALGAVLLDQLGHVPLDELPALNHGADLGVGQELRAVSLVQHPPQRGHVGPAAVDMCVGTPATRAAVEASLKLGTDVGVDQTPMLAINGRLVPVSPAAVPYETLKQIIDFEMKRDGLK